MQTSHELIVEPVGLDVETLPKPLNWQVLYGNTNPVELEIGMGKGTFLYDQAHAIGYQLLRHRMGSLVLALRQRSHAAAQLH